MFIMLVIFEPSLKLNDWKPGEKLITQNLLPYVANLNKTYTGKLAWQRLALHIKNFNIKSLTFC